MGSDGTGVEEENKGYRRRSNGFPFSSKLPKVWICECLDLLAHVPRVRRVVRPVDQERLQDVGEQLPYRVVEQVWVLGPSRPSTPPSSTPSRCVPP